jgi:hypothetical protein
MDRGKRVLGITQPLEQRDGRLKARLDPEGSQGIQPLKGMGEVFH